MAHTTVRVPRTLKPRVQHILTEAGEELDCGNYPRLLELLRAGVADVAAATSTRPTIGAMALPAPGSRPDHRYSSSTQRGLAILGLFGETPRALLGIADIADALGMPRSTAHRYAITLVAAGLLERPIGTRKYRLTRRAEPVIEVTEDMLTAATEGWRGVTKRAPRPDALEAALRSALAPESDDE